MNHSATPAAAWQRSERAGNQGWPAAVFAGMVLGAAIYAFAPRQLPSFPATQVFPDRLLINGLAQHGSRVLAGGEQGQILYADSPAGPWKPAAVKQQRGSTINRIAFIDDHTAVAVGHDGWILRSEDGGQTWNEAVFGGDEAQPLFGIAGPFDGKLFAYGGFGTLLRSADQGRTWQAQKSDAVGDKHLYGMVRAADGSLLLVGEQGLMLRSTDGGDGWSQLPPVYNGSFFGALNLGDRGLVVYGMRGHVFHSADSGKTWQQAQVPVEFSLYGGAVGDDGRVFLVGEQRALLESDDGGASFRLIAQGEDPEFKRTHASSQGVKSFDAVLPEAGGGLLLGGESGVDLRQQVAAPAAGAQP